MELKETDCCWNCKYFKGTHDDGKTKCGNPDQWNTWIKPQEGCEWWKEDKHIFRQLDKHEIGIAELLRIHPELWKEDTDEN